MPFEKPNTSLFTFVGDPNDITTWGKPPVIPTWRLDAPPETPAVMIGIDVSDGVEMHVEGTYKDGILHITDSYEIIDGTCAKGDNDAF